MESQTEAYTIYNGTKQLYEKGTALSDCPIKHLKIHSLSSAPGTPRKIPVQHYATACRTILHLILVLSLKILESLYRTDISYSTTRDDTFLDCSTGRAESILDTVFLLFHLHL